MLDYKANGYVIGSMEYTMTGGTFIVLGYHKGEYMVLRYANGQPVWLTAESFHDNLSGAMEEFNRLSVLYCT